jgi:cell division septation protein DedD
MEEQTTWKAHSFTLLVFGGIVVLCSIFFILGMLVGRAQGEKIASAAAEEAATKAGARPVSGEAKPDLTFYESVEKEKRPALEPPPAKTVAGDPEPPTGKDPAAVAASTNAVNYQIGALRKSGDADKLLEEVKLQGFKAFIIAPPPDERNPFYRVQIGPFSDPVEAAGVKKKLEAAGYKPILKK